MIRLCSSSITRAKLLDTFNVEYIQSPIDFNEELVKENSAKNFVYSVVLGKFNAALETYNLDIPILVADTVISTTSGEILRKAKNMADAREILLKQSGSKISIITATIFQSLELKFIDISATWYSFKKFDEDDLNNYLKSLDWQGKAGACMVEGFCKRYIHDVNGLESNAMGLPVEKILPWINGLND